MRIIQDESDCPVDLSQRANGGIGLQNRLRCLPAAEVVDEYIETDPRAGDVVVASVTEFDVLVARQSGHAVVSLRFQTNALSRRPLE